MPPTGSCYSGLNDISGLTANALSLDSSGPYSIQGNGLTLGAGGLSATAPATRVRPTFNLDFPITLSAPQTWTIGGNGSGVNLGQGVSGAADTVTANLTDTAGLGFSGDTEIGAFSAVGADSTNTGRAASANGFVFLGGNLNGTDGNAVNLTDVELLPSTSALLGPLTSSGAAVDLPAARETASGMGLILTVSGGVSLDSASATNIQIEGPGTTAGTDYSQLSAAGTVSLGGALTLFDFGTSSCPMLHVGDVDTLITTTGVLSGTFTGIPDGAVVDAGCGMFGPTLRINYTAHSVTATVITAGAPASSMALMASPANPVTNQPVTLTATITAASGSPSGGTVEFDDVAGPISGCDAQPVSWSGTSGTATCRTSFAADASPEELFAGFAPTNASVQGSGAGPIMLPIGPDSTATALAASTASPSMGQSVTYTATVTPADAGPVEPTGTVQFQDGGLTITSCGAQPLTAGVSSSTATCTVSYASAGSHSITAVDSGDVNFAGSTSPAQTVTVQSPGPTPTPTPTPPPQGPAGPSASQILAALSSALAPHGAGATIGALLSHGGYAFTFTAPAPGTLTISWYFVPPGAHISKAHKAKPVVIASARISVGNAGAARVTVRLTAAGRRMLKRVKTLGVVSKAGFQPTGGAATTRLRRFTLRR